jgi:hypothetical protein
MNHLRTSIFAGGISMVLAITSFAQQKAYKAAISVSANWNMHDAYIHKMVNSIEGQWSRILNQSKTTPPAGTFVAVKFTMDSKGRITEILGVEGTSSERGKDCCISALTNTAPYGAWTNEMIASLGTSQELTLRFSYE